MALVFLAAAVFALFVGATQRDEQGAIGLQMAAPLAMLAILWVLIGIMFTLARPHDDRRAQQQAQLGAIPAEPKRVNWFQDSTVGSIPRTS